MKRNERLNPSPPPSRLQRFVLSQWYDPGADPKPPETWWKPGESKRESAFEWHAVQAIKRYQAARRTAGLTP